MPGVMNAIGGLGKEAGQSIVGMLEKAVILIIDERGLQGGQPEIAVAAKKGKKSRDTNDITESLRNKNDYRTRGLRGIEAEKVLNKEMKALNKDGVTKTRALHVQFNPSTIQLIGRGGGRTAQTNYDKSGQGEIVVGSINGRIEFSVQLVFDRVNNRDAFFNEKFVLNPTSIIKGAVTDRYNAKYDKTLEVQTEVEGFIAALNGNATRKMEFLWGHLHYKGRMNTVSAAYTMFNYLGQPIRATIDLSMTCTEPYSNNENLGMWDERYRATFTEVDGEGNTKGKNTETKSKY